MLLTKKSEYAMLALVIIAKSDTPKNTDQLSLELNISKSFLAKILQNLARKGILNSFKGINGGFVLNKPSCSITILEIIKIVEQNDPAVFECTANLRACTTNITKKCTVFPILNNLQTKINDFLHELTLKDIL